MDHFNLLDFDNDVLNIIGDYVKKDNHDRMEKEEDKKYADLINMYIYLIYILILILTLLIIPELRSGY